MIKIFRMQNSVFTVDKECKNEVYVKKNPNQGQGGYVVMNRDLVGGTDHTGGTSPKDVIEMVSDANSIYLKFTVWTRYILPEGNNCTGWIQTIA